MSNIKYWAGGFGKQESYEKDNEKLKDFIKNNYWAAIYWDKDDDYHEEAVRIRNLFQEIKVGDKFLIKGYGGKHVINVHHVGQVKSIDSKKERLELEPIKVNHYKGLAPTGAGAGNWRPALLEIHRPDLIKLFFNDNVSVHVPVTSRKRKLIRRIKKAAKTLNVTEQLRKGNDGYVTAATHNKIQQCFAEHLKAKYEPKGYSVTFEENYVDIKLERKDSITFYEVKPYDSVEYCIRIGLGQILSYVCFDNSVKQKKIRIVGANEATDEDKTYIEYLKKHLNIDFDYIQFPLDKP